MVYFVATIRNIDIEGPIGTRVVGYFNTYLDATKCIEENWGDLYEDGYYKYAVIEGVEPGLYKSVESEPVFYKWINDRYTKIEKPVELKSFVGFTIG